MNNNKKIIGITFIALAVVASGCAGLSESKAQDDFTGDIDTSNVKPGTSFLSEMMATEANQQNLVKSEPIPAMQQSLERENLRKRYETLNDQNQEFHVYLLSYGKVVSYYVAQGKVSSVNSKLTQPQQLVPCDRSGGTGGSNEECVVDSPQLDGSYGSNGDGIFFYTTDGSYVEWNGEYLVSERPLNIQTPLSLEKEVE